MSDTLITIIAIFLAAVLMFIFPLMSISERNDDIAQSVAQTVTQEFVDEITTKGLIKMGNYEAFSTKLDATGNTYDIEIEVQHLDENPGKKTTTTSSNLIGENVRYSTFTSEILGELEKNDNYPLKKGDIVVVTVKNTNKTMAQTLRTFFYKVTGQGTYQVAASSSGMVVNTGR